MLPMMQVHLVRTQFRHRMAFSDEQRVKEFVKTADSVLAGDSPAAELAMRDHVRRTSELIQRLPDDAFAAEACASEPPELS
jgi:DNA-binding GntR family transcriptional regulator